MAGPYLEIKDVQTKVLTLLHDGVELYREEIAAPISDSDLKTITAIAFRLGFDEGVKLGELMAKQEAENK